MFKIESFSAYGLSSETLRSLERIGYVRPSLVQEKALGHALDGKDLICQAKTGSGKTAIFAITIVERIDAGSSGIQALVLAPTRELAIQVTNEINRIGYYRGIKAITIYGGQDIRVQFKKLKEKPRVIVCTPGRLLDHVRRGSIKLDDVRFLVIDEADKMLEIGFLDDIRFVLRRVSDDAQLMLFSATMPSEIIQLAKNYLKNPYVLRISEDELSVDHIHQVAYKVKEREKLRALINLLYRNKSKKILIFTNTKKFGKYLFSKLKDKGFYVRFLSGDLKQETREKILYWFRRKGSRILVASDVASRGLDIVDIDLIINYDFPRYDKLYVHRIGRTGRFGRAGFAISLVTPLDEKYFQLIKSRNNIEIKNLR